MTLTQGPFTEESDPFCVDPPTAAALLWDAPWRRFAVIGDSLSVGTGDPTPGYVALGWPERVAGILRLVRPDLAYLNLARIGATTAEALREQTDRMLEFEPDLIHLPSGGNDIVCRTPDFGSIERTLRRVYDLAAGTGADLAVITLSKQYVVEVFPDFRDRVRVINDITRRLAAEFGAVVVEMWGHPVNERSNLLSADGIHWSTSGQAAIASEFVRQFAYRLEAAKLADPE